jgi:tetratricopeptide (TPR) repeat protein
VSTIFEPARAAWREVRAFMIAGRFGEAFDRASREAAPNDATQMLFDVARAFADIQRSGAPENTVPIAEAALAWARANDEPLLAGAAMHALAVAQSSIALWRMAPADEDAFRAGIGEAAAAYTAGGEQEAAISVASLAGDSFARQRRFDDAFAAFAASETQAKAAGLPLRAAEMATRCVDVRLRMEAKPEEVERAREHATQLWNEVHPDIGAAELALTIVPHLRDLPNATELLAGAAPILESANRLISACNAWNSAATIAFERSRMADARAFAEEGIRVTLAMQFAAGEGDARGTRAAALSYLGHFSEAEAELLRLQSLRVPPAILFATVVPLINNYLALGRADRAEPLAHQLIGALESFGMTPLLSTAWLAMGNVLSARRLGDAAIAAWKTGIEVDLAIGDKHAHAGKLAAIALTTGTSGKRTEALRTFEDAERLLEGDASEDANAVRADIAQQRAIVLGGRAALEPLEQAANFWLAARRGTQAATALTQHGLALLGLASEPSRALDDFARADAIFREHGLRNSSWKTARFAFLACRALGRPDDARAWLARADEDIDLLQAGYTNADPLEAMITSMQQRTEMLSVYRDGIAFHLDRGALVDAFEWIEKMKARVLLDALQKALVDRVGELQRARAATYAEVLEMLRAERILLVQCFAGDQQIVLLGARADWAEPRRFDLPLDTAALARDLVSVLGNIDEIDARGDAAIARRPELCALAETMAGWCEEGDLIAILPGGFLHLIPLHALRIGDRTLVERNRVVYAPSASVLRHCLAAGDSAGAAVFGDPRGDLEWAREEAEKIAPLLGVSPVLGPDATADAFTSAFCTRGHIHYAGHALFDADDALESRIALAGRDLTAREIIQLRGGCARFVVLSGCETAVAQVRAGDEIVGLSRALLHAGAASLLLTLWEVDDDAAAFFMDVFYASKSSRVDAFREAQLATMRAFPSFSSWAAFVLIGAWT